MDSCDGDGDNIGDDDLDSWDGDGDGEVACDTASETGEVACDTAAETGAVICDVGGNIGDSGFNGAITLDAVSDNDGDGAVI